MCWESPVNGCSSSAGFPSAFSAAFLLISPKQTRLKSPMLCSCMLKLLGQLSCLPALWASCRYIQLPLHLLGQPWPRMTFLIHENLESSLPTTAVRAAKNLRIVGIWISKLQMGFALNVLIVLAVEEGAVCLKTSGTLASIIVLISVFQS